MSQTSLTDRVTPIEAGGEIVGAGFLGRVPALALADGHVLLAEIGAERRIKAHEDGAILVAVCDGGKFYTGGDDGAVAATDAAGSVEILAREKGWIDALTCRADGALAWSNGKNVRARDAKGEIKHWTAPSSVRGLAFFPKGFRVAVAHYNGVSLWFPNTAAAPETLNWKGSHLDVAVSPDARYVVTSMQENSLHGWRLSDRKDMRMTGYPAKTRSFAWSHDGLWFATSGADGCIVWPFSGKDGPMGQPPRECGVRPNVLVTAVAFHPKALVVAVGYDDGWILLVRLSDGGEILARRTEADAPRDAIAALAFDANGGRLLFGAKSGCAGILDFPS
ncbi:WD40 repeat domain-containing protein [Rhodoblastus acidophilus]|uniref:WD40 repeat domain-containing protein n=1 Tax=Candidatus Rhodoblastus alkanivorans TaxID=2954117 RepID=A0ABS9Z3W3_9HYPH|nr:WD40 repeat domain-containing protein [Candidatus Rhodoblastus alkanivorans]MCI4677390.1 WD40 repeat domain-containing protein [Candidatus Rhodoblastus alkanivorans]MCI4682125.1 WD40 repeat domain-containing protein [Candidatus Rhodoblastus alkanivorans]MDI4639427.1 WD40 repeat domain-containing protein [Rhodoblastus acidophilus]